MIALGLVAKGDSVICLIILTISFRFLKKKKHHARLTQPNNIRDTSTSFIQLHMCLDTYKPPISGILLRMSGLNVPEAVEIIIYLLRTRTSVSTLELIKVDIPCEKRIIQ